MMRWRVTLIVEDAGYTAALGTSPGGFGCAPYEHRQRTQEQMREEFRRSGIDCELNTGLSIVSVEVGLAEPTYYWCMRCCRVMSPEEAKAHEHTTMPGKDMGLDPGIWSWNRHVCKVCGADFLTLADLKYHARPIA